MSAPIAVDTETYGVEWWDLPFLATVHDGTSGSVFEIPDDNIALRDALHGQHLVFHNAKFDLQKLILAGVIDRETVSADRIEDTEAMAHLLDEHQDKKLKVLAHKHLGESTDELAEIREAKKVVAKEQGLKLSEISYDMLPREIVVPYAIKDVEFTIRLYHLFKPQIDAYEDLRQLYRDEMELSLVLLDMEAQTMKLDVDYLNAKTKEFASKALLKELEIRDIVGKEDFNPNSPKQILEAFEALGIELAQTNKIALRSVDHPLANAILELRHDRKMLGTYLEGLQRNHRDGYVHLNFRQHGPKTGRMASGGSTAE